MATRITRSAGLFASAAAVILLALGAGPAWAQRFRGGGNIRMPVRAPVQTSVGFSPFTVGAAPFTHTTFGNSNGPAFATQPFTHREFGNFNANGVFVPSSMGSAVISSRHRFPASTGTFVPMRRGPFTLTAREAFSPSTGTFTPSAIGPFAFQTRGEFLPTGSTFMSPWHRHNPWHELAEHEGRSPFGWNPFGMNPYAWNAYGMNPSAFGMNPSAYGLNPYSGMYANPYIAASAYGNPWASVGFSVFPYANPYTP